MAEDQERILLDEVVRLQETVAQLQDQGEKDVQSIAHMADMINNLAVRVTQVESDVAKLTEIADYLARIADSQERRLVKLSGGNDGTGNGNTGQAGEASHVTDGGRTIRDDGPEYEDPGPTTTTDLF